VDTVNNLIGRLRRFTDDGSDARERDARHRDLESRVAALEAAVEENRRLNQRLADVVDVVTELLVPALDRDDARVAAALADLNKTLNEPDTAAGAGRQRSL
jgi:ATP/maltotriose-dependent transcriptional regulator MalT